MDGRLDVSPSNHLSRAWAQSSSDADLTGEPLSMDNSRPEVCRPRGLIASFANQRRVSWIGLSFTRRVNEDQNTTSSGSFHGPNWVLFMEEVVGYSRRRTTSHSTQLHATAGSEKSLQNRTNFPQSPAPRRSLQALRCASAEASPVCPSGPWYRIRNQQEVPSP